MKRVYEPAKRSDGYRILIDRLWPRGVSRERAALDAWDPELAPSTELRTWFGHDPVASTSSAGATWMSFARNVRVSRSSGGGPATARSRSFSPLETRSITTLSFSPESCAEGYRSSVTRRDPQATFGGGLGSVLGLALASGTRVKPPLAVIRVRRFARPYSGG
jgi:Protein of unknown function, DUF488